jgi:hypothetical protein
MRRSLVFALRARNVDVLTAAEASMINREDDERLAAASAFGRTLFTHNTADYSFCINSGLVRDVRMPASSWRRNSATPLGRKCGGS